VGRVANDGEAGERNPQLTRIDALECDGLLRARAGRSEQYPNQGNWEVKA
jgi:hypothetical protein